MKISNELNLLIEAIRVVLLKQPVDSFKSLAQAPHIRWERVKQMVAYHGIRPVFYEACRLADFSNVESEEAERFTRFQAMRNLITGKELSRILALLKLNDIKVIPYKGILFLEKLYQNSTLRESSDMDIVVKPEDAVKALKLLVSDGYAIHSKFTGEIILAEEQLFDMIDRANGREVGLVKEAASGFKVHIDFHWAFGETYHGYTMALEELFEQAGLVNFKGHEVYVPDTKTIFKMLLNHHGGRGCWLRLKDFCDWFAYQNSYPEHNSSILRSWAEEMKMTRVYDVGHSLAQAIANVSANSLNVQLPVEKNIINFWETSVHYDDTASPKIKRLNIYRQIQDKPLSWFALLNKLVIYYSRPNRFEKKRIVVFSDRYVYLNAGFKFISFFWYRFIDLFKQNFRAKY
jgi:hypothetical protein